MYKKIFSIAGLLFIMILFSGTANALEVTSKNVSVINNGILNVYETSAQTVKEFLNQENINVSSKDYINCKLEDSIVNKMSIEIEHPFILEVLVDGEQNVFNVKYNDTVSDLINLLNKEYGKNFVCEKDSSFKLRNCSNLKFLSKRIEVVEKNEVIPFQVKVVNSDTLQKGKEKIVQDGVNGEKTVVQEITFVSDKEVSRNTKSEKITKKPVEKIIMRGTADYKNVLIMNASAYTAGFESTGKRPGDKGYGITASGTKAAKGTVAVDPKVIPLGSKLYIEGYGYATALDTGGAIKGNKIDLFYDSLYEAKQFGRRTLTVYILS